jgi:chromosome segregation ATPase
MKNILASVFTAQNLTEVSREGLPYWIFWLLLCIIILLLAFIFLRDKDMRRRLDSFFSGIKKNLIKIRLHSILKREKTKQENFILEIGQKCWEEGMEISTGEAVLSKLTSMEEILSAKRSEQKDSDKKIQNLKKNLEKSQKKHDINQAQLETDKNAVNQRLIKINEKENEINLQVIQYQKSREATVKKMNDTNKKVYELKNSKDLSAEKTKAEKEESTKKIKCLAKDIKEIDQAIDEQIKKKTKLEKEAEKQKDKKSEYNQQIKSLNEKNKHETRRFHKEIKEWEKTRHEVTVKILEIDKNKKPLYQNLGRLVNDKRIDNKELAILYSKIDRSYLRENNIKKQIKNIDEQ